jgi:hypothetical protein
VWLVLSRQREPINDIINRHLDVLLHRYRYVDRSQPELRQYQLLHYQPVQTAFHP